MSLDHILLGALEEPRSGYDLKQWFDEVFAFFWNADQSQIYRTINKLADQGLVSGKAVSSTIGPDKRVYRTTAKGRAELKRWLREGPVSPSQRTAIYAQLIFLSDLSDAEAAQFLRAMKAQADAMVAALSQVPETEPQNEEESRTRFFNSASLGLGLARAKATQAYVAALVEEHAALVGKEDRDGHAA
ncbi:MAG: PadR family transcriptional regulator [Hyphomonadaceae bacterium]|nr:PadR family transcriptional regulator [Hyphomonadaceae bacterium]